MSRNSAFTRSVSARLHQLCGLTSLLHDSILGMAALISLLALLP